MVDQNSFKVGYAIALPHHARNLSVPIFYPVRLPKRFWEERTGLSTHMLNASSQQKLARLARLRPKRRRSQSRSRSRRRMRQSDRRAHGRRRWTWAQVALSTALRSRRSCKGVSAPICFFFALIRLKDDSATAACTHAVKEKMRL